jgi:hypothetical protein
MMQAKAARDTARLLILYRDELADVRRWVSDLGEPEIAGDIGAALSSLADAITKATRIGMSQRKRKVAVK